MRGTSGSVGLDLFVSAQAVLTPQLGVQALGTGVFGSLPECSVGIVFGKSSSVFKVIKILPGNIYCDYTSEIKIMIEAGIRVLFIPQVARIA